MLFIIHFIKGYTKHVAVYLCWFKYETEGYLISKQQKSFHIKILYLSETSKNIKNQVKITRSSFTMKNKSI